MSKRKQKKPHRRKFQVPQQRHGKSINTIDRGIDSLCEHLTSASAVDVYLALLIQELWLPNISAQGRHALAMAVMASQKVSKFSDRNLSSYADFTEFLTRLQELLPTFPMMEDYVPELDWGEVRVAFGENTYRTFYGGAFERIPDFIETFVLADTGGELGRGDLRSVLEIQDHLLRNISQSSDISDIYPGHLEIPPEGFWARVGRAVRQMGNMTASLSVSSALVVQQGDVRRPMGSSFSTEFMPGKLMPFALIDFDGVRLPISPRNLCSVVIHHWEQQDSRHTAQLERETAKQTAYYLATRFKSADFVPGPMRVDLGTQNLPDVQVAGLLCGRETLWVVAVIDARRAKDLRAIENRLHVLVEEHDGLVAQDLGRRQFLHSPLRGRSADAVRLMAVIVAPINTAPVSHSRLRVGRSFFLVDMVSIVESVRGMHDLEGYFSFVDDHDQTASPFAGHMDQFAAYRYSHGLLVGGAIKPTMIMLDPHGGSNFRFDALRKFWSSAPSSFPDESPLTWLIEQTEGTLLQLRKRSRPQLSWCADRAGPALHFILDAEAQDLELADGRILELFVHCISDAWNERAELFPSRDFKQMRIVTYCRARQVHPSDQGVGAPAASPLLTGWVVLGRSAESLEMEVDVDLSQVSSGLEDALDAQFEVHCAKEWLKGLCELVDVPVDEQVVVALSATADRRPRFTLSRKERTVDVPEHPDPSSPELEHFKIARRDLAIEFHADGVEPGRYELKEAKTIINSVRNRYRKLIHERICEFDQEALIRLGVEQFDQLVADYDRENTRLQMSLQHDVDYDRVEQQAGAYEKFVRETRNVRYLLEFCYSRGGLEGRAPENRDWQSLLALVDWLLVLYGASDTLHNELEVGGVIVDRDFIPEVFYDDDGDRAYQQEAANEALERDNAEDRVAAMDESQREQLNVAFVNSVGFSLTSLLSVLAILGRWTTVTQGAWPLAWSYDAPKAKILEELISSLPDVSPTEIEAAVAFLTLDANRVCRLAGSDHEEGDVPVWEHRKRDHRYTIRPLLRIGGDRLLWGAAAVHRSLGIWSGTFSDGYPPADLGYPEIDMVAAEIKKHIENGLEIRAVDVFSRHLIYFEHGVDFHRRYPKEGLADVGDFDVLAYRPESNQWFMVECKYNKPPFCIKDARRLREEIFGKTATSGQLAKIERRRAFLEANADRLRELLNWPAGAAVDPRIEDLYVCPRIFPFMRRTPRPVSTLFVRLGKLDVLLSSKGD